MNTSGDWLEVGDIQDPGIGTAVPADGVDRVEVVPVAGNQVADFDAYFVVAALGMCDQFCRAADVALAIGRML